MISRRPSKERDPEKPASGRYYIGDSGWACDKGYSAGCNHWFKSTKGRNSGYGWNMNGIVHDGVYMVDDLNERSPFDIEAQSDGSYKIFQDETIKGETIRFYWQSENDAGSDWLEYQTGDKGDTWRLEWDGQGWQIWPMKNCKSVDHWRTCVKDRGCDFPCGEVLTYDQPARAKFWDNTYFAEIDNPSDGNKVSYSFVPV